MSRRRTRYRFLAVSPGHTDPERIDVLSYSPERALEVLRSKGWTNAQPVIQKAAPAGSSWVLHTSALRQAVASLGITHSVMVKQTGHRGGRRGAHSLRRDAQGRVYSHITVKSWLDPAQASRTLWHELAHAMQAQRAMDDNPHVDPLIAWKAVRASTSGGITYRDKPIEIEARSYEHRADDLPLAR